MLPWLKQLARCIALNSNASKASNVVVSVICVIVVYPMTLLTHDDEVDSASHFLRPPTCKDVHRPSVRSGGHTLMRHKRIHKKYLSI